MLSLPFYYLLPIHGFGHLSSPNLEVYFPFVFLKKKFSKNLIIINSRNSMIRLEIHMYPELLECNLHVTRVKGSQFLGIVNSAFFRADYSICSGSGILFVLSSAHWHHPWNADHKQVFMRNSKSLEREDEISDKNQGWSYIWIPFPESGTVESNWEGHVWNGMLVDVEGWWESSLPRIRHYI